MRPIEEQVILVTGSTDGLGRAVARALAERGATVLMHGRDPVRLEAAMLDIRGATGNERVVCYLADLSSLAQVRGLADRVLAEHERLDVLVSNAGIGTGRGERELSEDGHELRFAVNYLAGFLLIRLLEPLLVRSAPARIVSVASAGQAPIDFDDVMLERDYSGVQAYCQSKLAQVMLTFDLAEELAELGVTATVLHPGTYMPTKMVLEAGTAPVDFDDVMLERDYSGVQAYCQSKLAQVMLTLDLAEELADSGVTATVLHPGTYMPTKMVLEAGTTPVDSLETGVEAVSRLIADPEVDGVTGAYFVRLRESRALDQAYDPEARRRLRELSADLVGVPTVTG